MNTLKIGLLAGMLSASSLAFSSHIDFDRITAQTQGCTLPESVSRIPITLVTKNVKWYDIDGITKTRKYYCHYNVPKKYRHLITPGFISTSTRCHSLDVEHDDNTDYFAEVWLNKSKALVICTVYSEDYFPN
jgi:hypothetical protein